MAKLPHPGSIGRGDVLRARRRVHYKRGRGGILVVQKWPKRRGKKKTPLQQAWVDDFSKTARATKQPESCALQIASSMSPNTGWYYRDVLAAAAHGKLINAGGQFGPPRGGSVGFLQVPKKLDGGIFRVLTPTACYYRAGATTAIPNAVTPVPIDTKVWDNSAFFDSAKPTRLTMKAAGLYLVGGTLRYDQNNSSWRWAHLRVNGSTIIATTTVDGGINTPIPMNLSMIWPFSAGDYVELCGQQGHSPNVPAKAMYFYALAITPETLVP